MSDEAELRERLDAEIRARKDAQAARAIAEEELEAFAYAVSHDLRAPLRGLNGFAQILLEDHRHGLGPDAIDCLEEIQKNAVKMATLIDALLALSRVTRRHVELRTVDLSGIARAVLDELRKEDDARRVDTTVQDGLVAEMDAKLARTMVQNLLANAWKFTSGKSHARIEVGTTRTEDGLALFVSDDGAGFDNTNAARLFGPFQRLHAAHEFPGTGTGLATVQRIVHKHGGRVWAKGELDKGATFYVALASLRA
jgi:light-regulated signal transduction histidine kinase (bacteriophytochrome)